ncbi:putative CoA-binding protein [Bernardetia litoralis DSM 6794]|uniref:Putative CoA-binding protein n=1 Tax=Bernardetia litoralis (strain ATCC 23117 / DSM 6794 / NBRC 15988 / NCIMB 1366 / Fx l1 / Sio-4) TaxID=880071 RepID=I4AG40_BERLS|nr:CoA-binding protein [Bernardetia litoralis]AFM02925.1 putative CoA-binding protein [Bernardetia litoralis DSM 6794]
MENKKTLILGATPNPTRYAYLAAEKLTNKKHEIVPVGIKQGEIFGQKIEVQTQTDDLIIHTDIDTITMYVGLRNQPEWYNYILETNPKRIIFNPGTENPELVRKAQEIGIKTEIACTLVLLSSNQY